MKNKAYDYGSSAIFERSSTIDEDIDELRKEIYGEEEAEKIKQKEIKEHKKLYPKKATHNDIIPVWEMR